MANRRNRGSRWRKQDFQAQPPPVESVPEFQDIEEEDLLPTPKRRKQSYRNTPKKRNPFVEQMSIKRYKPPKPYYGQ